MGQLIKSWTVDYGDGEPQTVQIPHAWKQDMDVRSEGPVQYSTQIEVPNSPSILWFEGVSYEAAVSIEGQPVLTHRGIWDAFEVPLDRWSGKTINVTVDVTKNGGERFPVKDVASGFLPFVYHTFGGIWGEVEIREASVPVSFPNTRVQVAGHKIYVDDRPFHIRGLLHWGWYPDLGHHNAPEEVIRREIQESKKLGFNLMKFCLWVPSHRYLEILREEGMEAWLELPLWDPSSDQDRLDEIGEEIERIVRQYRHHDNIIVWTVGCELSHATPPVYRKRLVDLVKNLTGCPLVKDNSGGAEMYGGDLQEFGDFFDYHPYCDTPFYPVVLDSLLPGPREQAPILLGEFNDIDIHRDLVRIHDEMPYWASAMPELNDKGVRWQHDLPYFLRNQADTLGDDLDRHHRLMESSRQKSLFMRKYVHEAVRSRDPIAGYVITGIRDTPISTSGFFDDWLTPRFSPHECLPWNSQDTLFLIPTRRPPWVDGGNRPGWLDPFNHFVGQVFFKVGIHSERNVGGGLVWQIARTDGRVVARGTDQLLSVYELEACEVGQISWFCTEPGQYRLTAEFGDATNNWDFWVEEKADFSGWSLDDPFRLAGAWNSQGDGVIQVGTLDRLTSVLESGGKGVVLLNGVGTKAMPFWREAMYEFSDHCPFKDKWGRLLAVSGDSAIDQAFIAENLPEAATTEILMKRIDVRTYEEAPMILKATGPTGSAIITTLRPYGGLGVQPFGIEKNPAGNALLKELINLL